MPIYEYQCDTCGEVVEVMQRMGAPAPASCKDAATRGQNNCEGKLRRLMSTTSVRSGSVASQRSALDMPACGRCGIPGGPCAMGGNDG
ncbi:MAG: zinc ribbon domain-containing protein [Planctomycetota bacterium]|nr:zinc ribbon domain-containing protein [Planctomycetota bacterium]MDA1142379.1 zinc ribbon domain-containing protein [Planctomycetota bacterium]